MRYGPDRPAFQSTRPRPLGCQFERAQTYEARTVAELWLLTTLDRVTLYRDYRQEPAERHDLLHVSRDSSIRSLSNVFGITGVLEPIREPWTANPPKRR